MITLTLATVLATKYIFFDTIENDDRLKKRRVTIQDDKDLKKFAQAYAQGQFIVYSGFNVLSFCCL